MNVNYIKYTNKQLFYLPACCWYCCDGLPMMILKLWRSIIGKGNSGKVCSLSHLVDKKFWKEIIIFFQQKQNKQIEYVILI